MVGVAVWIKTDNPLSAVVLVTIIDAIAFVPTFRKSYYKPNEETLIQYALASLKWVIGLFAIESLSLTTGLYPISLVATNGAFVVMALIRRRQIIKQI